MLAIGLVVDDAIVVVEAVMHHIEHGMSPKEATSKAMKEVGGPVVAIAVILSAVFIPVHLPVELREDCISSLPLLLLSPFASRHLMHLH